MLSTEIQQSKVKAIIFDCFGVLVSETMNAFCNTYLGDNPEGRRRVHEMDHLSNAGMASWDDVVDTMIEVTGLTRAEVHAFLDRNPPDEKLFEYIKTNLHGKYKIGLLSNAADNWLGQLFTPDQLSLFDDFVLSYEHSMRKPSIDIFELAAKRLGVESEECLFVDDVDEYCQGARMTGMQTIQYISFDQFRRDIETTI